MSCSSRNYTWSCSRRRFADRLQVELPNPAEIPAVWVPSLILQPLIENAVVHGMAGHQGTVRVKVTVRLVNETILTARHQHHGADRAAGADGIGLKNVRERMAVQFEGRAALMSARQHGSEWISEISMPAIRESPPAVREAPAAGKLQTTTLLGT